MQANAPPVGGPDAALQLLQIVALLLPLVGIFLQVVIRAADRSDIELHPLTLIAVLIVLIGLIGAGMGAVAALFAMGTSPLLRLALSALLTALAGITLVVTQLMAAFVAEEADEEESEAIRERPPRSYRK